MTVPVLLFASYADAAGRSRVDVAIPRGATVADAVAAVRRLLDARSGGQLPAAPLVAVNAAYASAERVLEPGDEVALIPPVAGG